MIEQIPQLTKGATLDVVGKQSDATAKVANAFRHAEWRAGDDWGFDISDGNVVLTYPRDLGGVESAATPTLWQPYPSPYVGTGTPPANQAFKIRIRQGTVNGTWIPSNQNIEINVPQNSLVPYFIWLKAELDENENITSLAYDHGTTLPAEPDSPPSVAYTALFFVTSTATRVNFPNATSIPQYQTGPLNLIPATTKISLSPAGVLTVRRKMIWLGENFPAAALPTFDEIYLSSD